MADIRRSRPPSCRRSCSLPLLLLLVLLLATAALPVYAAFDGPEASSFEGGSCPLLTECMGGVASESCCAALQSAVDGPDVSCVCKELKRIRQCDLARKCKLNSWCPGCKACDYCVVTSDEGEVLTY